MSVGHERQEPSAALVASGLLGVLALVAVAVVGVGLLLSAIGGAALAEKVRLQWASSAPDIWRDETAERLSLERRARERLTGGAPTARMSIDAAMAQLAEQGWPEGEADQ